MTTPRWPWALLALAMAWVALSRVPLVLNAGTHLDSDLAVEGLTLAEAIRGHWRWHYPTATYMGIIPLLLSYPQALIWARTRSRSSAAGCSHVSWWCSPRSCSRGGRSGPASRPGASCRWRSTRPAPSGSPAASTAATSWPRPGTPARSCCFMDVRRAAGSGGRGCWGSGAGWGSTSTRCSPSPSPRSSRRPWARGGRVGGRSGRSAASPRSPWRRVLAICRTRSGRGLTPSITTTSNSPRSSTVTSSSNMLASWCWIASRDSSRDISCPGWPPSPRTPR